MAIFIIRSTSSVALPREVISAEHGRADNSRRPAGSRLVCALRARFQHARARERSRRSRCSSRGPADRKYLRARCRTCPPKDGVPFVLDELPGDANAFPSLAHAAFEHVANAKLAADLLDVDGFALVGEGRISRDDEKRSGSRQSGDDVLDHPVGEIFLLRIVDSDWRRAARRWTVCRAAQGRVSEPPAAFPVPRRWLAPGASRTVPTKRNPFRGSVLIRRCSSPESPIALRATFNRVVSAASETMRPSQIAAIRSSLLTTCSRLRIK